MLDQNTTITSLEFNGWLEGVDKESLEILFNAVAQNHHISSLKFINLDIGSEDIENISILNGSTSLTHLDLIKCYTLQGELTVKYLSRMIQSNTTLKMLDLTYTGLDVPIDNFEAFGKSLQFNCHLLSLNLSDTHIGSDNAKILSEYLIQNTTLESLSLYSSRIKDVNVFGPLIEKNSTLKELNLEMNVLSGDNSEFCRSLEKNTTLGKLNMGTTGMQDTQIIQLANAMKQNKYLYSLNLGKCPFATENAANAVIDMLKVNTSLLSLHLFVFEMPPIINQSFLDVAREKSILLDLRVIGRSSSGGWETIAKNICKRNRKKWMEKVRWCAVLNVIGRVIFLSTDMCMPNEMIMQILSFLPPEGMINVGDVRRVCQFSSTVDWLGKDIQEFGSFVFGEGLFDVMNMLDAEREGE